MPRFLDRIIFIDSSGQEQTVAGGSVSGTPGTLALRDNTGRFLVGDTSSSSTDGYVVVNKNYVDGRISSLTKSDTAVSGKYVSKVSESSGEIEVTRTDFPTATSSQLGVVQRNSTYAASGSDYGFIKTGYTNDTTNKNYAVKLNNNGDAYVNVPGSAYSNGAGLNLSGTSFSLNRTSTTNNTNYSIYFGATNTGAVCYNNSKLTFNPSSGLLKTTKMQCTSAVINASNQNADIQLISSSSTDSRTLVLFNNFGAASNNIRGLYDSGGSRYILEINQSDYVRFNADRIQCNTEPISSTDVVRKYDISRIDVDYHWARLLPSTGDEVTWSRLTSFLSNNNWAVARVAKYDSSALSYVWCSCQMGYTSGSSGLITSVTIEIPEDFASYFGNKTRETFNRNSAAGTTVIQSQLLPYLMVQNLEYYNPF